MLCRAPAVALLLAEVGPVAGEERLEPEAKRLDLVELLDTERRDARAPAWNAGDEPLALEPPERVAERITVMDYTTRCSISTSGDHDARVCGSHSSCVRGQRCRLRRQRHLEPENTDFLIERRIEVANPRAMGFAAADEDRRAPIAVTGGAATLLPAELLARSRNFRADS